MPTYLQTGEYLILVLFCLQSTPLSHLLSRLYFLFPLHSQASFLQGPYRGVHYYHLPLEETTLNAGKGWTDRINRESKIIAPYVPMPQDPQSQGTKSG